MGNWKQIDYLTYGDQKLVLIAIWNMLIVEQWPKMGFGHDMKNLDYWMVIENSQSQMIEFGKGCM